MYMMMHIRYLNYFHVWISSLTDTALVKVSFELDLAWDEKYSGTPDSTEYQELKAFFQREVRYHTEYYVYSNELLHVVCK